MCVGNYFIEINNRNTRREISSKTNIRKKTKKSEVAVVVKFIFILLKCCEREPWIKQLWPHISTIE